MTEEMIGASGMPWQQMTILGSVAEIMGSIAQDDQPDPADAW